MSQKNSNYRVSKFGEVKTNFKEIKRMTGLVDNEVNRIDSRFLEPACGDGNFLSEILNKKLLNIFSKNKKDKIKFEIKGIYALSSLYGIELLEDNVIKTRERLYKILEDFYNEKYKVNFNNDYKKSINKILSLNVIHGDALSLKKRNGDQITFSEWTMINDTDFIRRDFVFSELLDYRPFDGHNLFSDLGDKVFIPSPVKEYKTKNYLKLHEFS